MLKQTFKIVSYLIIALSFGIIITLIADSIENITVEKRIRKTVEDNVRNVVASFKDSAPNATTADEIDFVKRFAVNVMGDKIVAREHSAGRPPEGDDSLLFLFTLSVKDHDLDFYLHKAFLRSELAIIDIPEYIAGIVTTVIVFTFIMQYMEHKKRARMIQQQFESKNVELRMVLERNEAMALMGRMSAALAHELKTPLSTISNLIHVLPSRFSDEQFTKRFVVLVREELERTQQLTDNLLAYGKEIELRNEEWLALRSLLHPAANRYHMAMIADIANTEIRGDRFYLDLLFQNIFRNSREAGADEVRVSVHCSQSAAETVAEIICEDNGAGYPEIADLDELTKPFVSSRSRGGGLGLYLVKKIVTAHDGALSLFRKEKGAGVKIIIPRKRVRING
jgi:signal transduction histidine kinase